MEIMETTAADSSCKPGGRGFGRCHGGQGLAHDMQCCTNFAGSPEQERIEVRLGSTSSTRKRLQT